jgi:capsular polysaccharide biosynthesis protein
MHGNSREDVSHMNVRLVSLFEWIAGAERRINPGLPVFKVAVQGQAEPLRIQAGLTEHRDLVVCGKDFVPIRADGAVLLEQAYHSPALYIEKQRALRQTDRGLVAALGPIRDVPGRSVVVGSGANHYHWLIDYLPRLLLAQKYAGGAWPKVVINSDPTEVQLESLRLAGIGREQMVEVGPDESVRCEQALFPWLLAQNTLPHPALVDLLRALFERPRALGSRRVYLSRRDARSRRLSNESELIELITQHGFEVHVPGAMKLQAQMDVCAEAAVLLAVHGAAMANMVFCPPKATVIEIFTPAFKVTSMQHLARFCGLNHQFVPAPHESRGPDGNPLLGDWRVDLSAMHAALRMLDAPK